MGKKGNPALIGAFVVGAVILAVAAVAVIGGGRWFSHRERFVCYFSGSVNGLKRGAPVKFKGVEVGTVAEILLTLTRDLPEAGGADNVRIPVIIELGGDSVRPEDGSWMLGDPVYVDRLIDSGLRAQLSMESLVTGLLYVALDVLPDSAPVWSRRNDTAYTEIPTVPTALELARTAATDMLARLEKIDLAGLVEAAVGAFRGIEEAAQSPQLAEAIATLPETLHTINSAASSVRKAAKSLNSTSTAVGTTLVPLAGDLRNEVARISESLVQLIERVDQVASNVRAITDPDSRTVGGLEESLHQLGDAARALRDLAGALDRNPRSVIFGRPPAEE